jgi:hypothetical protein
MRLLRIAAAWAVAGAAWLLVAVYTKFGRVVVTFGYQEGLHLGDLVAAAVLAVAALAYTARELRRPRR